MKQIADMNFEEKLAIAITNLIKVVRENYQSKIKVKKKRKPEPAPYLQVIVKGEPNKKHRENTTKVMFPAHCLFTGYLCSEESKKLGIINTRYEDGIKYYYLHDCSIQCDGINQNYKYTDLDVLFREHNIEIVKVKIIAQRG